MQPFRVGDWTAYPKRDELEGSGNKIRIEPRVMQVLVALAERADEVVTREELLETVWNGTFVSDEVLTNAIRELRKALDDDAKSPRYVQTLPKKGYRLVAPVRVLDERMPRNPRAWLALAAGGMLAALIWSSWPDSYKTPPDVVRLTTLEGEETEPALSPDGTHIAFSAADRGSTAYHLYVMSAGGGEAVKVVDSERVSNPAWSPDGDWIAFAEFFEVDGSWSNNELRIVPSLGGSERVIAVTRGWFTSLDWSPDGRWLAAVDRESDEEANAIYLYPVQPGEKRKLTNPPMAADNQSGDGDPRFSPDGTQVAFVRGWHEPPNREDIYVQRVDGSDEAKRVTFVNGNIVSFDWLPDGRGFVCSDGERLYYVPLDSGELVPLSFGEGAGRVSISGERLAYTVGGADSDVWRFPGPAAPPDAEPMRLATSGANDVWGQYSPDGSRFLFVSTRTGRAQVWGCDASEKDRDCEQLTFFEDGASRPAWSPEGDRIAFMAHLDREEGSELYVMDVEDRLPRRLTTDDRIDMEPSWSRDGETLYFASRSDTSEAELWKISVETGHAQRIGDVQGVRPRESGDGRFLYYAKRTGFAPIARVPLEGGAEEIVVNRDIPYRSWDLMEGELVYLSQARVGRHLNRLNLDTMETTTGGSPVLDTLNWGLSVSPDGRWVLVTHWDGGEIDIMLVEDFLSAIPR